MIKFLKSTASISVKVAGLEATQSKRADVFVTVEAPQGFSITSLMDLGERCAFTLVGGTQGTFEQKVSNILSDLMSLDDVAILEAEEIEMPPLNGSNETFYPKVESN